MIVRPCGVDRLASFPTKGDDRAQRGDVEYWWPRVVDVLERHGVDVDIDCVKAGAGGTFPTLVCGDVVIKLFGHLPFWRRAHHSELPAMRLVAEDPSILAPRLLFKGQLFDDPATPWPYLVTTRISGDHWEKADLSDHDKSEIAADLGRQVRRIASLAATSDIATPAWWSAPSLVDAATQSVLPPHLIAQVEDYVAGTGQGDPVFVHGDLMFRHVFVQGGRLSGIIDWGDALVADRHYELAQIQLNLFDGDKTLLRTFLDRSDWPVERDFAQRALAQAFRRQAVGLAQHRTMDVFHKLPRLLPLDDIATLDEMAEAVFGV